MSWDNIYVVGLGTLKREELVALARLINFNRTQSGRYFTMMMGVWEIIKILHRKGKHIPYIGCLILEYIGNVYPHALPEIISRLDGNTFGSAKRYMDKAWPDHEGWPRHYPTYYCDVLERDVERPEAAQEYVNLPKMVLVMMLKLHYYEVQGKIRETPDLIFKQFGSGGRECIERDLRELHELMSSVVKDQLHKKDETYHFFRFLKDLSPQI